METKPELLTTRDLARRLQVTPETVRSWARRGLIPTLRVTPKVVRYNLAAVLAALAKRQEGAVDDE